IVEFISTILIIIVEMTMESYLPAPLQEYLTKQGSMPVKITEYIAGIVAIFLLFMLCLSYLGLWLRQRWARIFYTALCLIFLAAGLYSGAVVQLALARWLSNISWLSSGIILSLIWFSELRAQIQTGSLTKGRYSIENPDSSN